MNTTVAFRAESETVANVEAACLIARPMLHVVGMQIPRRAALAATVTVASQHRRAPFFQVGRQARPLIRERGAAFPMASSRPDHASPLARARAVNATVRPALEANATDGAGKPRSAVCPAGLAAVFRGLSAVAVGLVRLPADNARERDPRASSRNGDAFQCHAHIIPWFEPSYCETAVLDG